ncbi:hypothetical protein BDZ97DRAFT_1761549 [Flammula alnicola]|nr:hypothetical protein BDZ97DRAFT_1761549 [Flammula alnicola]
MKYTLGFLYLSLGAILALLPVALVAAGDDGNGGGDDGDNSQDSSWSSPNSRRPKPPGWKPPHPPHPHPERTQVLWGQCGGYYYSGTTKCPDESYCRYFSDLFAYDWGCFCLPGYAQCNPNNN